MRFAGILETNIADPSIKYRVVKVQSTQDIVLRDTWPARLIRKFSRVPGEMRGADPVGNRITETVAAPAATCQSMPSQLPYQAKEIDRA